MLNAKDAEAAIKALPYPSGTANKDERAALRAAYNEGVSRVNGEFRDWLANEYAPTLPGSVKDKVWGKAWEDGHSGGFNEVEGHYRDYAEFAEFVMDKAPRPTAG